MNDDVYKTLNINALGLFKLFTIFGKNELHNKNHDIYYINNTWWHKMVIISKD